MMTRQLRTDISEALNPTKLSLPARPRVEEIQWWEFTDQIGEDALRVVVVLDADTTTEERGWLRLKPIEDAIFDRIRAYEISLYPYIRFVTRTELELEKVGKWA